MNWLGNRKSALDQKYQLIFKDGSGNVVLWTSTLDNYWNDLALKPVYLPLVHQVMRHLATY